MFTALELQQQAGRLAVSLLGHYRGNDVALSTRTGGLRRRFALAKQLDFAGLLKAKYFFSDVTSLAPPQ